MEYQELRTIVFNKINYIEIKLRRSIAYSLGQVSENFHNEPQYWNTKKYKKWHADIKDSISRKKITPLRHHNNDIKKMPIWVVVEYVNFGHLLTLLDAIKGEYQNIIIKELNLHKHERYNNYKKLKIILYFIKELRNSCCHFDRIFDKELRYKNYRYNLKSLNNTMDEIFKQDQAFYNTYDQEINHILEKINKL